MSICLALTPELELRVRDVVIATTNVGHLSRFAPAELWQDIQVASS